MRTAVFLGAVACLALAGCGAGPPSAESVVRAWSQALNQDDNQTAAKMFAPGAKVVQAGGVLTLHTHGDAVAWNAALPCSGRILSIHSKGNIATATFLLGDRPHSQCDGPVEGQFHWVWPATKVYALPGPPNLAAGPVTPLGPERSSGWLDYFFPEEVSDAEVEETSSGKK